MGQAVPAGSVRPPASYAFADIRLSNLLATWSGNGALSGTATAELFGEVSVFIGAHKKGPVAALPKPEAAVLLGARAQRKENDRRLPYRQPPKYFG